MTTPAQENDAVNRLQASIQIVDGETHNLEKDRVVLGRNPDCDIPLLYPAVGRYHTQLVRTDEGYLIEDLKSRGGTYLNDRQVVGQVALKDNDRIQICGIIMIYHSKLSGQEQ